MKEWPRSTLTCGFTLTGSIEHCRVEPTVVVPSTYLLYTLLRIRFFTFYSDITVSSTSKIKSSLIPCTNHVSITTSFSQVIPLAMPHLQHGAAASAPASPRYAHCWWHTTNFASQLTCGFVASPLRADVLRRQSLLFRLHAERHLCADLGTVCNESP